MLAFTFFLVVEPETCYSSWPLANSANCFTHLNPSMNFPSPHFIRFLEHMAPFRRDSEIVIVLTGHLLIEELLVAVVDKSLKYPNALSRHSFHDYLCLARAMAVSELDSDTLDAVEALNRLRNQLAHNLDSSKYQLRRCEFLARFPDSFPSDLVTDFGEMWCALMTLHRKLSVALDFDKSMLRLPSLLSADFSSAPECPQH